MFIGQSDIDAWCMRLRKFLESIRKQARPQGKKAVLRVSRPVHAQDAEEKILENQIREWLSGFKQSSDCAARWAGRTPIVVITTTPVGIRACEKLAREPGLVTMFENCFYLTEYEYRYWCKEDPDPDFQFHINYWAWMKTSIPKVRMHEFRSLPVPKDNEYWLLRHGVNGMGEGDYADCWVFAWNGASAKLLAKDFHEGVPSV